MDNEERQHLEKLLQTHQRRLRILEQQGALRGVSTPPEVSIEIEDIRAEIAAIRKSLASNPKPWYYRIQKKIVWITAGILVLAVSIGGLFRIFFIPTSPTQEDHVVYKNDFSNDIPGQMPLGWSSFGNAPIEPTIEYAGGRASSRKVLIFPNIDNRYEDKTLIRNDLDIHPPYTVTVKLNFQTNTDNAGIVVGWKGEDHHTRILSNVFHDKIEIWETLPGQDPIRYSSTRGEPEAIDPEKNYWLRVIVKQKDQQKYELEVQWSEDGHQFISTNATEDIPDPSGRVGITTTGPNLPRTIFDDFQVEWVTSPPS